MEVLEVKSMNDGDHYKCPRCWSWHPSPNTYDNLCIRCEEVILKDYPDHEAAYEIKKNMILRWGTPEQKKKYES